jgi:hypothetical protein
MVSLEDHDHVKKNGKICVVASDNDTQENLAKFGYMLSMKIMFGKHNFIISATFLNHV